MNTDDIKLFHRIVETGSLADTAELLQQPKSTLSRRIKAMETELNVKLFHRQNRSLILTGAGDSFYQNTQKIIADYSNAVIDITDKKADICGKIRIQMFPMIDSNPFVQIIFAFMAANPNIKVDIIASADPLDINGNNFDIAFWVQAIIEHQDMVSRPVGYSDMHYFASPSYLKNHGTPKEPAEISQHQCIMMQLKIDVALDMLPIDQINDVKVKGSFCTNSLEIVKNAVLKDIGIAILPMEWCREEIASGKLVALFGSEPILKTAINLVYPSRRFVTIAAQRFIDFFMDTVDQQGLLDFDFNLTSHHQDNQNSEHELS